MNEKDLRKQRDFDDYNRELAGSSSGRIERFLANGSTPEQSLDLQTDALKEAGYDHIFCDHGRSGVKDRPELRAALELAQEGDTFMVWRLDRVARSMKELLDIISGLNDRGVRFLSLNESFDVSSALEN